MKPDSVLKKKESEKQGIRHYYYVCTNRDCPARSLLKAQKTLRRRIGIDADMLDDAVKILLRHTTEDESEIKSIVQRINRDRDTNLPSLESELRSKNYQLDMSGAELKEELTKSNILNLSESTRAELERLIEDHSTRIHQLRESVSALERQISEMKGLRVTKESVMGFMENIRESLGAGTERQRSDLVSKVFKEVRVGLDSEEVEAHLYTNWYTGLLSSRTTAGCTYPLFIRRPDIPIRTAPEKTYRNPVIYARELHEEMVRDNLTRRQLAERHDVSSDRITQWLCLLKLPEENLLEIEYLGDNWDRQVVTERELRTKRRSSKESECS